MTKHAVRFQNAMIARMGNDRGQGALEYIGILLIVGVIVAAVIVVFQGQQGNIETGVGNAITDFLSGDNG